MGDELHPDALVTYRVADLLQAMKNDLTKVLERLDTKADKTDLAKINARLDEHAKEIGVLKDRQRQDEAVTEAITAKRRQAVDFKRWAIDGLIGAAAAAGILIGVLHV